MHRNMKPIEKNSEIKIASTITAENYKNVVIRYKRGIQDKKISSDFQIILKDDADKIMDNSWTYFESKRLINILESYFENTLDTHESLCCICYDNDSIEFLVPCKPADSICSDCIKQLNEHPTSKEPITNYISLPIVEYLKNIKQEPDLKDGLDNDDPVLVATCLQNVKLEKKDYDAFTDAVNNKRWKAVLAFVKVNPDKIQGNQICINAYENALFKASQDNQNELKELLLNIGCCALHFALVTKDNYLATKFCLFQENIDFTQRNADGKTAMTLAIENDNTQVIGFLLNKHVSVTSDDLKALIKAAEDKKWNTVINFIERNEKPDLNCLQLYSQILLIAAQANKTDIVELLLKKNTSPDYTFVSGPDSGSNAIQFALRNKNIAMLKLLLAFNANPDAGQYNGNLSASKTLDVAFAQNDPELIEILCNNKNKLISSNLGPYVALNKAITNKHYKSAAAFIRKNPSTDFNFSEYASILDDILTNKINEFGINEILEALAAADFPINQEIMPVNNSHWKNQSPLQWAVNNNKPAALGLLLTYFKNIKIDKKIIIDLLSNPKKSEMAIQLIRHDKDPDAYIKYSHIDAMSLAAKSGSIELRNTLKKAGCNAIHDAIIKNDNNIVETIQFILNRGVNCEELNDLNQTPLDFAITKNNPEAIEILLKNKAKLNLKTLTKAAEENKWAAVNKCFEKCQNINKYDDALSEILILAAKSGQLETVKILISNLQISPNTISKHGKKPLQWSLLNNYPDITAYLLQKGAFAEDETFKMAAKNGCWQACTAYLTHHKNVFGTPKEYQFAIQKAIEQENNAFADEFITTYIKAGHCDFKSVIKSGQIKLLKVFLSHNKNIDINKVIDYDSPLQIAIENNNLKAVTLFLEMGVVVTPTIVKFAIKHSHWISILEIIKHRNDASSKKMYSDLEILSICKKNFAVELKKYGCGEIHDAITKNDNILLEKLLKEDKLNPDEKNEDKLSPLDIAFETKNAKAIGILLKYNTTVNDTIFQKVCNAGKSNNWEMVIEFLNKNNTKDYASMKAYTDLLFMSAEQNQLPAMKILMTKERFSSQYSEDKESKGWGMIHFAIKHKNYDMLELLLAKKLSPEDRYSSTTTITPLEMAMENGDVEATELLLKHGANPDCKLLDKAIEAKRWSVAIAFIKFLPNKHKLDYFLQSSCNKAISSAVIVNNNDFIEAYIDAGLLSLQFAIQINRLSLLEKLCSRNKYVIHQLCNNKSALEFAMEKNLDHVVAFLLQKGAKLDYSLLVNAIKKQQWNLVSIILNNNIDPAAKPLYSQHNIYFIAKDAPEGIKNLLILSGCRAVYIAASLENTRELKSLLELGYNADELNDNGDNAFNVAYRNKNAKAIGLLAKYSQSPDFTILAWALKDSSWDIILAFVKNANIDYVNKCDINKKLYDEAFTKAAKENKLEVMQAIAKIYNPEPFLIDGNHAIHFAVLNKNEEMVASLNKADLDVKNSYGQTPLSIALIDNHKFITTFLLGSGASLNDQALLDAIHHGSWKSATAYIEHINYRSKHDKEQKNQPLNLKIDHPLLYNNEFILKSAVKENEILFLFSYLYCGLLTLDFTIYHDVIHEIQLAPINFNNLNNKLENGLIPIQFAYKLNKPRAIGGILKNKAEPDYEILVAAIKNNQTEIAIEFITHNTDINAIHFYRENNLLFLAVNTSSGELINLLLQKGCNQIHQTISQNDMEALENLILMNISCLNEKDITGKTPLQFAWERANSHAVELLLTYKAIPDYDLLIMACESKNINWDLVATFIKNNSVDVNHDSNFKHPYIIAFLTASKNNKIEVMETILYQKTLFLNDYLGSYALSVAIENDRSDEVKKLFSHITCKKEIINNSIAHLDHALSKNNFAIIMLLLTYGLIPDLTLILRTIKFNELNIAFHLLFENPYLLNNQECKNTYLEALNIILATNNQHKLILQLLPALFLNLTTEIKNSLSDDSKIAMKGVLLDQYINKFSNEKFIFNDFDHVKNTLINIISITLQREKFAFFSSSSNQSTDALCELLCKPEYKHFLDMICPGKTDKPERDDLIAFVNGKDKQAINDNDRNHFDYSQKDVNYSTSMFKIGKK